MLHCFPQVAAELQSKPVGSALFHPASSKPLPEQLKCISLSIKLAQLSTGVLIQHVEVRAQQQTYCAMRSHVSAMHLTTSKHVALSNEAVLVAAGHLVMRGSRRAELAVCCMG